MIKVPPKRHYRENKWIRIQLLKWISFALLVTASLNGEFTVKVLEHEPVVRLVPRNCRYSPIVINEGDDFEIFGVVTNVIRTMKRQ